MATSNPYCLVLPIGERPDRTTRKEARCCVLSYFLNHCIATLTFWVLGVLVGGGAMLAQPIDWLVSHPEVSGTITAMLPPRPLFTTCVLSNCTQVSHGRGPECSELPTSGACWTPDYGLTWQCSKTCLRTLQGRLAVQGGWIFEDPAFVCEEFRQACLRVPGQLIDTPFEGRVNTGRVVTKQDASVLSIIFVVLIILWMLFMSSFILPMMRKEWEQSAGRCTACERHPTSRGSIEPATA